jgi:hypothetical protein
MKTKVKIVKARSKKKPSYQCFVGGIQIYFENKWHPKELRPSVGYDFR